MLKNIDISQNDQKIQILLRLKILYVKNVCTPNLASFFKTVRSLGWKQLFTVCIGPSTIELQINLTVASRHYRNPNNTLEQLANTEI